MNYDKAIHAIIDPIVEEPDLIFIKTNESEDGKDVSIIIATEKNDIARLIGRHGSIANAIREMVSVAGKVDNKRIHIKFESFNEEKED
ncbi:MAG TPA: KH domain-containing protein [Bacilli bacterium]|nr:KH domain-containing protein [Bacilli bacterium]HPS18933.1 KH domain-containing protein [Bacilli bacterium]